jgi:hypothetical protein
MRAGAPFVPLIPPMAGRPCRLGRKCLIATLPSLTGSHAQTGFCTVRRCNHRYAAVEDKTLRTGVQAV